MWYLALGAGLVLVGFAAGLLVGRKHSKELEKTIAEIRRLQGR